MDINKAIEISIEILKELKSETSNENNYKAFNTTIGVLEKTKAKKPNDIDTDFSCFECGNCEKLIYYSEIKESHNYCLNCGQKLDWGDGVMDIGLFSEEFEMVPEEDRYPYDPYHGDED